MKNINLSEIPFEKRHLKIFGCEYLYLRLNDGGELYLTEYGLPFWKALLPENWYIQKKKENKWEKLQGSGTVYRIYTKEQSKCPIDFVLKFSRIGQDVPGRDVEILEKYANAEFNSPFEEFSLLMEMRDSKNESPGIIRTHKPLCVYVPAKRENPELMGRKEYKFNTKVKELDIELDLYRQYLLLYEWVKGIDVVEASDRIGLAEEEVKKMILAAEQEMEKKGFKDWDRKPRHLIVRILPNGKLLQDKKGNAIYAYVDFEMLQRTPEREKKIKAFRRSDYLVRQRDRFDASKKHLYPPNLKLVDIFGVEYVYGKAESTGGVLWVVGRDPVLFEYFLPERWRRTPRKKLSHVNQVYYTLTKDNIHLVWRISRVGEKPDLFGFDEEGKRILDYGHNSPFEEFALALYLSKKGLPTIYPRAIYRTGHLSEASEYMADYQRYESHKGIVTPDGEPILQKQYNYICVWGHWNGPDELLAVRDGEYYSGINLSHAYREGIISENDLGELVAIEQERLKAAGVEDLNFHADHLLLSLDHVGNLIKARDGKPELRICNFELLKRI